MHNLQDSIARGSFENEALENEDEARSTQISKTKHPKLENEDPKSRKRSTQNSKTKTPKSRKRSTQNAKPVKTTLRLAWRNPNQVEAADAPAPPKVHKIHPKVL